MRVRVKSDVARVASRPEVVESKREVWRMNAFARRVRAVSLLDIRLCCKIYIYRYVTLFVAWAKCRSVEWD